MSDVADRRTFNPKHGGLKRAGPKRSPKHLTLPPWHGWKWDGEAARIIRWIESELVQPVGVGQGQPMRMYDFERKLLRAICESFATFISIPAGNGKTTFNTAVGLERVCRGDEYVEVDIIATNEEQARRLVDSAIRMVESSGLTDYFEFYNRESILEYVPTGSRMRAYPAKLSAIQGLDFNLALIDEIGDVPTELTTSMLARLGKRPGARVIGFGTPGTSMRENMLESLRALHQAGELPPGVEFVEYAAEAGCDIYDEKQHRIANPAIDAGFLDPASLPLKAATMPEHLFRAYHLGQPVGASAAWLPFDAWQLCVQSHPPRDGTPVVLALWGNYRRRVSIVGATLDGAVFFGWQAEKPADAEVEGALRAAAEQWEVLEICHKPHIRLGLMAQLADEGLPIQEWSQKWDIDATAGLYQAIASGELAHDHDEVLTEQIPRLVAKIDRHGHPTLVESSDPDVSAALAARAAWWRGKVMAESEVSEELVIY